MTKKNVSKLDKVESKKLYCYELMAGCHEEPDKSQKPKVRVFKDPLTGEEVKDIRYPVKRYMPGDRFQTNKDLNTLLNDPLGQKFKRIAFIPTNRRVMPTMMSPLELETAKKELLEQLKQIQELEDSVPNQDEYEENESLVSDSSTQQSEVHDSVDFEESNQSLPNFHDMTKSELVEFANGNEITLEPASSKKEIIAQLEKHFQ